MAVNVLRLYQSWHEVYQIVRNMVFYKFTLILASQMCTQCSESNKSSGTCYNQTQFRHEQNFNLRRWKGWFIVWVFVVLQLWLRAKRLKVVEFQSSTFSNTFAGLAMINFGNSGRLLFVFGTRINMVGDILPPLSALTLPLRLRVPIEQNSHWFALRSNKVGSLAK